MMMKPKKKKEKTIVKAPTNPVMAMQKGAKLVKPAKKKKK